MQLGYFFQLILKRLRRLNYCVKRRPIAIVFFRELRANNALRIDHEYSRVRDTVGAVSGFVIEISNPEGVDNAYSLVVQ